MKKTLTVLMMVLMTAMLFVSCDNNAKEPETKTYKIGDEGPAGGIIIYVADTEQTSTYVDKKGQTVTYKWKYLEAAPSDLTITEGETNTSKFVFGYYFNNGALSQVGETADGIGKGRANTRALVNAMGANVSTTSSACTTCNSVGTVSCIDCGGDGKTSETTCTSCNGSKSTSSPCTTCSGTGWVNQQAICSTCNGLNDECPACGGTGYDSSSTISLSCSSCGGAGRVVTGTCTTCSGTGKIALDQEVTCSVCAGTGSVECSACKATRTGDYVAKLCDDYSITKDGTVYDDWFLPSKEELTKMYENLHKKGLGSFDASSSSVLYWSSSEYDATRAYTQYFGSTGSTDFYTRDQAFKVRPIRSF